MAFMTKKHKTEAVETIQWRDDDSKMKFLAINQSGDS